MPLLSPNQIHKVKDFLKDQPVSDADEIKNLLSDAGLGPRETIETISEIMRGADTSNARLNAANIALKLNKILVDDKPTAPVVNIIINDSEYLNINPILIPR